MPSYDAIVIGGGTNGLAAAGRLAKAGARFWCWSRLLSQAVAQPPRNSPRATKSAPSPISSTCSIRVWSRGLI